MGEHDDTESVKPASGLVSSPRGYFGRASRAAANSLRAAAVESPPPPLGTPQRPSVYRSGDPALRVFGHIELPYPPTTPLTGAVATLSGIADGEHEKLMIELGTSLVRATPQRDEAAGTYAITLTRTQGADVYRALLTTVRYVNDAAEPHTGPRRVAVQTFDAAGTTTEVANATIAVGDMPVEAAPIAVTATPMPAAAPVAEGAAIAAPAEVSPSHAEPAVPVAAPVLDKRVVLGESMRFNSDGDFTLFWWPRLLANGRARRPRPAELMPEAATPPGSFFSQGGRNYRVFDPEAESPPAPRRAASQAAADATPDAAPPKAEPREAAQRQAAPAIPDVRLDMTQPANDVWMPGRGLPPPGFEPPPALRLEDVFGSDMENALLRRIIEHRVAARA